MKFDWTTAILAMCLICSVTATVVVVVLVGSNALAGTGLGALTTGLAGALGFRIKNKNGNGGNAVK